MKSKTKTIGLGVLILVGGLFFLLIGFTVSGLMKDHYSAYTTQLNIPIEANSVTEYYDYILVQLPEYTDNTELVQVTGLVNTDFEFSLLEFSVWRYINESRTGGLVEYNTIRVDCEGGAIESVLHFRGAGKAASIPFDAMETGLMDLRASQIGAVLDANGLSVPDDYRIKFTMWRSSTEYIVQDKDGNTTDRVIVPYREVAD